MCIYQKERRRLMIILMEVKFSFVPICQNQIEKRTYIHTYKICIVYISNIYRKKHWLTYTKISVSFASMITIDGQSVEKHVPFIKKKKKTIDIRKKNEYLNYDDLDGAQEFFTRLNQAIRMLNENKKDIVQPPFSSYISFFLFFLLSFILLFLLCFAPFHYLFFILSFIFLNILFFSFLKNYFCF